MRAPLQCAVLVLLVFWTLGASWASPPPDPVGEHAYRTHIVTGLIPVALIMVALLAGWLIQRLRHKDNNISPQQQPHQC